MKTIGQVEDIKNNSIIYFNKDDGAIYRYYPLYDRIDLILNGLTFDKPIDAEIISDMLIWTDNDTEPKKINIVKAQAYSNPWVGTERYYPGQIVGYDGKAYMMIYPESQIGAYPTVESAWELVSDTIYTEITDESIRLLKGPEKLCPSALLVSIADNPNINSLQGNIYQFARRLTFFDGEKSVLSDYSVPVLAYKLKPELPDYDHILVRYEGDPYQSDVKSIDILVRKMTNDYAWTGWGVISTLAVDEMADVYFSGSETIYYIDDTISSVAYHNVPNKVACLASIDEGKKLGLANYEDGYDPITVDASVNDIQVDSFSLGRINELMNRNDLFFHRFSGKFGIVYKDNGGRISPVYTSDQLSVSINNSIIGFTGFEWAISHTPPEWATSYRWVRTRDFSNSGYTFFLFYPMVEEVGGNTEIVYVDKKGYELGIEPYSNYASEHNISYEIEVGDLVRFPTFNNTHISVVKDVGVNEDGHDVMYLDTLPEGIPIPGIHSSLYAMEIWKPGTDDGENSIFFEFGQSYKIENGVHLGPIQNQGPGVPARGIFTQGNTYYVYWVSGTRYTVQALSKNKFHDMLAVGETGRVNVVNDAAKKMRYPNYIKLSGNYFDGTLTNGLNEFDFNSTPLNERYGEIVKMMEVGVYTLKVVQRSKITSIYIGKEVTKSGPDGEIFATTSQTLGTIRTPEENYGSTFKNSVVKNNRHLYLFDIYAGAVVRDAPNGLFPVSSYGMTIFFKDLAKSLLTSGVENVDIHATFDSKHDEFLITFVDSVNPDNNQTWVFHEASNSWTYELSAVPELWASRGQFVVSFKDGELWKHEASDVRNNFYGVQYQSEVDTVFNDDPLKYKTFKAVYIDGNGTWSSPNPEDITIVQDNTNKRGMKSRLVEGKFKWINGAQYAPYMRDMLTTSNTPQVNDLINGRELRGKWIRHRLESWNTDEVIVAAITADAIVNEISGG